ncbi:MAG: hypothetical protein V7K71_24960 [Nostoc sp.]|uniref:hypothetical protein n=1 Tax=Nostoc sp. TaxID=1180 RepID=UPI002FF6AC3D
MCNPTPPFHGQGKPGHGSNIFDISGQQFYYICDSYAESSQFIAVFVSMEYSVAI